MHNRLQAPVIPVQCADCNAYLLIAEGATTDHHDCTEADVGCLVPLDPPVPLDECVICERLYPATDMPGRTDDGPVCEACCERQEALIEGAREAAIDARMEQMIEDRIRRDRR